MIVVTGGAGFIGSALIWALNRRGQSDILVVDRLDDDERWRNLRVLQFADYLDKDEFIALIRERRLPGRVETILHMGACSDTAESDAAFLLRNNFEYSKWLIEYAVDQGVRLVYASSAATYGDGAQGYADDESQLSELRPLNKYGYSKHLTDLWAWRRDLLALVAGVKFSNVFGPNEYHKEDMRSVVHKAFDQIGRSGQVELFKSYRSDYPHGGQTRDFIYVKDAVDMTLFLADHPNLNGLYNIGTGQARTWNDLAKAVFAALGLEPRIEYIEMPDSLRPRYQYHTRLNMEKLRQAGYGQTPRSLEQAVADYVQNYLKPGKYLGDE